MGPVLAAIAEQEELQQALEHLAAMTAVQEHTRRAAAPVTAHNAPLAVAAQIQQSHLSFAPQEHTPLLAKRVAVHAQQEHIRLQVLQAAHPTTQVIILALEQGLKLSALLAIAARVFQARQQCAKQVLIRLLGR